MNAIPLITRPRLIQGEPEPAGADGNRRRRRVLALAALGGAGLLALFWTLYFTGEIATAENPAIATFESAFWAADGVLALMLVIGAAGLLRNRTYGVFCLVGAAAMTLYLGLLDVTFYVRQGFYTSLDGDVVFQGVLTLCCLAGGVFGLLSGWKLWGAR